MVNYNSAPNKKSKLKLETTALKQSRSDLNVAFSTADRNTGIFEFTVTQDNKPLLLGESNIETSIVYIHQNGLSIRSGLDITDGLNGKISTLVPNDLITVPGKVTAQVYVAKKQKDQEIMQAVVAERIFCFTIEQSLAWSFSGETKLNYIIEFDELKEQIMQRVVAIETAIENLEDYVVKVEQARDKGLQDIEIAKTSSLQQLQTLADERYQQIDDKGKSYVTEMIDIRTDINSKVEDFNENVSASYVKQLETLDWQKHDITDAAGLIPRIESADLGTMVGFDKTGSFYLSGATNTPFNSNSRGYMQILAEGTNMVKAIYLPSGETNIYQIENINGDWTEWSNRLQNMETLQGSQLKVDNAIAEYNEEVENLIQSRFEVLWEGSVKEKGLVLNTSKPLDDYRILLLTYGNVGGEKTIIKYPQELKEIIIQDFNLSDVDGGGARLFECVLTVNDSMKCTVKHNHSYLISADTPQPNSNNIEIIKIVGVK